jgi:trk system potassium uptake protein TrkA
MLSFISHAELDSDYQFGNGEVDLVRLDLPPQLVERNAADINVPGEIQVVCVVRGASARIASAGTVFKEGDILFIAVARESQTKFERLLGLK